MRLNEVNYDDSKPIDGYGPGFFRIGGQMQEGGAGERPGRDRAEREEVIVYVSKTPTPTRFWR